MPRTVSPKIGLLDQAAIRLFDRFAGAAIETGYLRFVLPNGDELVYGDAAHTAAPTPKGGSSSCVWGGCCEMHRCGTCCGQAATGRLPTALRRSVYAATLSYQPTPAPCSSSSSEQARSGGGARLCAPRCACSTPASSVRSSPAMTLVRLLLVMCAGRVRFPSGVSGSSR